ncbi:Inhibitory regulator protein BUD2/CLA2 [Ceratocystis lukuohia]|uniref:Inhibitory regulator protein BUD2/CLA2 n=1 Tax=Ceratocystis lukuohia TaxID=2019550 RepID=A0ABR4MMA4_9PEZI
MDGKLPTANFKASILHAKKPDRESPVPIRASTFGTTTTITSNSGSITSSSPSRTTIINAAGTSDNTSPSSKDLASAASTTSTVSTTSTAAATASPSSKRSRLSAQPHPPSSSIPIAPITRKAKIPLVIPSAISDSPAPQDASNSLVNGDESPEGGRRQGIVFHESFQASPLPDANVKPKYPSTYGEAAPPAAVPPTAAIATASISASPASSSSSSSLSIVPQVPHLSTVVSSSTPPPPIPSRNKLLRQRTSTLDGSFMRQPSALGGLSTMADHRSRVGSFSATSSSSLSMQDDPQHPSGSGAESLGYPSIHTGPFPFTLSLPLSKSTSSSKSSSQLQPQLVQPSTSTTSPSSSRDKKSSSAKRRIKRSSSRPTSPVVTTPPCIDSLSIPIATTNANKILLLMKTLCGRMRGDIEYQTEAGGPWYRGVSWIEEDQGCLMFDSGHTKGIVLTLCADLRGSRIVPVLDPENGRTCLDLITGFPLMDILIRPCVDEEVDLWIAALLCWQQVSLPPSKHSGGSSAGSNSHNSSRPELRRRGSSLAQNRNVNSQGKSPSIIKVAKVHVWDKGFPKSPREIFKSPSPLDSRTTKDNNKDHSWARVSCLLQDNGELQLLAENDVSVLTLIDLHQLSRSAIQRMDCTLFDDMEFCLAIYPMYAPGSTHLSIFRPIYMSFESHVFVDVWYVLLRAFAQPRLFRYNSQSLGPPEPVTDIESSTHGEIFRIERTLKVRIVEAKLKDHAGASEKSGHGHSRHNTGDESVVGNYFAEVLLDGEIRTRTAIKHNTKNPFWREDCVLADIPPSPPLLSIVLKRIDGLEVEKKIHFSKPCPPSEHWCGTVDIPIDQMQTPDEHEHWLPILNANNQSIGTMLVKIHHEEMAVLLASEYESLRELLQRFPSGLTSQIARQIPGGLRRLAEVTLDIFQVSGKVHEWLMSLVEEEIDGITNQAPVKNYRFSSRLRSNESIDFGIDREQLVRDMSKSLAGEANLLFRGNSLLTQALECYMRRLGKGYLEEVLRDKIVEINEMNPNCEIDPSKLESGDDIQRHWALLIKLTTEVWACISQSANQLPTEMRHILKYVRAVAEDRYGDFLRAVSYTSVTGFLFLRFICPAILSPKLFSMLRDLPEPRAQRTFTLIAKALQAMANLSTFGQKESWMEPMNKFLNSRRASLKLYVDEVCSIPADQAIPLLPPSYSTPLAIMNRLSATAREGIPVLPHLVDPTRSLATLVSLWSNANSSSNSDQPGGDIALFNSTCQVLHHRAAACLKNAELLREPTATSDSQSTEDIPSADGEDELSGVVSSNIPSNRSTSSLASLSGMWTLTRTERSVEHLRAPSSAGSDVLETASSRRRLNSTRDAAADLASGTGFGALGRLDMQSLAQLQLQTQAQRGSGWPSSAPPMSPIGTLRGSRNGRTTRNILSGIIRMGRGSETGSQAQAEAGEEKDTGKAKAEKESSKAKAEKESGKNKAK